MEVDQAGDEQQFMPPLRMVPGMPHQMEVSGDEKMSLSPVDMQGVAEELRQESVVRDASFEQSRAINSLANEAVNAWQYGLLDKSSAAVEQIATRLREHEARFPRLKNCRDYMLQQPLESYVKLGALRGFLQDARVVSSREIQDLVDDEEYLGGVLSTCQDLAKYALRQASILDVKSVQLCRWYIGDVKEEFLSFDLRNGPLRRKYDTLKYAERRCEDLLYQLSLADQDTQQQIESMLGTSSSSSRPCLLNREEWAELRERYAAFDAKRELVIKGCRDVQKAAKQAIFAAHRGDSKKTQAMIDAAKTSLKEVWEANVKDEPALRSGSFSGSLEELAEAEMFFAWLVDTEAKHIVPERASMALGLLSATEYVGALSDFTGEVGRVAVEAATKRDNSAVRRCLETCFTCYFALVGLPISGKGPSEKLQAAERNLWKIEGIEYDLAVRVRGGAPPAGGLPDEMQVAAPDEDAAP